MSGNQELDRNRLLSSGECKLCKQKRELQLSHILPAFVFKWQRNTSGNGHLRSTVEPNVRVQDGVKRYWLCGECEQLFSRSEHAFATQLFHPYIGQSGKNFAYGPWLLHFCVSVSWRLLTLSLAETSLKGWSVEQLDAARLAESAWREYLIGERSHPGQFRQHLLPTDQLTETTTGLAPNINRYIMRAISMDICVAKSSVLTYAKLGRFMIFGTIIEKNPHRWKNTKVSANEGVIGPKTYSIPGELRDYWNSDARKMAGALEAVSPRQKQKIEDSFKENVDRYLGSDSLTAMQADIDLFGHSAFASKDPSSG